jgi:hypothetical protein
MSGRAIILDRAELEGRVATALHELDATSQSLHALAKAIRELVAELTASDGAEPLRHVAVALQSNALQAALGALSTRAMAERLATIAYLLEPTSRP